MNLDFFLEQIFSHPKPHISQYISQMPPARLEPTTSRLVGNSHTTRPKALGDLDHNGNNMFLLPRLIKVS